MEHISNGVIACLALEVVFGILMPVVLLLVWKAKTKCKLMPALVGAIIFIVFALVLESLPKMLLFTGTTEFSKYILNHIWAYVLAGALLAGIFEEVGRFVAFKFVLKKYDLRQTAITYGIGHGGIEAIIVLGLAGISTLALALAVNSGTIENTLSAYTQEQADALMGQISVLANLGVGSALLAMAERISAMLLHISASVFVFAGVKQKGKGWLILVAILAHALFDVPAVLYQLGMMGIVLCEVLVAVEAIIAAVVAYKIYQGLKPEENKENI